MSHNTYSLTLQIKASDTDILSSAIWEEEGVLGIQESPVSGGDIFQVGSDFEFLEFGTEAAKRCAEWLEKENFRGDAELLLEIHLSADAQANAAFDAQTFIKRLSSETGINIRFVSFQQVKDVDYLLEYQKNTKGICFGKNLWVGPPWDKAPADCEIFFVEPGLAFGTGDHPTTQLCLEALEALRGQEFKTILDVGTGSGILAAAARRFFPHAKIVVTDLDPLCEAEFNKTFEMNGLSTAGIEKYFGPKAELENILQTEFRPELIISNIYAEVLALLAPQIHNLLKNSQAPWLLSGVLEGPSEEKLKRATTENFLCQKRLTRTRMQTQLSSDKGLEPLTENWVFMELRKK